MTSIGLWLRWSWRDLRKRWLQVVAIALVIALGSGTYTGLTSTAAWRRLSYDASYQASNAHDLLVSLAEGTTVDGARLRAAVAQTPHPEWFSDVTTRLVVPTQVDASIDDRTILVPGQIVGVEVAADGSGPPVDTITVRDGRPLASDTEAAALLDVHFSDHHHLPSEGSVTISGGRTLPYVGTALSPQYFLIRGRGGTLFGSGGYAVLWTPLAHAQELAGTPGQVSEAGIRVGPGVDVAAAADELTATLETALPDVATTITPITEEREYRILYDDINGDQRLFNIFALLIMAGAAFAAFNLTGRIVEAQRREIGVGMSLGVPRRRLAVRPLLVGLQVALFGVVLGIGVGVVVGSLMAGIIEKFFPLPVWETPFQTAIFLRGAALGLVLTFLATLYPVWRAVRVTPIEAITTGPRTTASGGLAPWVERLHLPGRSVAQMPLRNVLRSPRRAVLTALGIAAAIATLIGVVGMLDSFLATIATGEQQLLHTSPDRLTVDLQNFTLDGSEDLQRLSSVPTVAQLEPSLGLGGQMAGGNGERFDVLLDLLPFDNPIWAPTAVEGSLASDEPAVVISAKAARDLGVGVGDDVTLRYPVREGTGYRWEEGPVRVSAIHGIPYRFLVFMDLRHASLMNLTGIVNGAQVNPTPGTPPTELQRTLFFQPGVAAVEPISTVIDSIRQTVSQFTDVLDLIRGAVLLLALLIAFNSSSISSDERAREHATMFAFGLPTRRVLFVAMVESAIVGVIATGIGIALGVGLVEWMTKVLIPETLPDLEVTTSVSRSTYLTAVFLGIVVVALAPLLTLRKLRRMDIPSTLRVVE